MTNAERDYIIRYRQSGKSCAEIARIPGLSANTVKSFCQRNSIVPITPNTRVELPALSEAVCLCCGEKNRDSAPSQNETLLLGCMPAALVAHPPGHGEKRHRPPMFLLRACLPFFAGTEILQPRLLHQSEIWRERAWAQC